MEKVQEEENQGDHRHNHGSDQKERGLEGGDFLFLLNDLDLCFRFRIFVAGKVEICLTIRCVEDQKSLSDRERKVKTGELLQARYIAEKILKKFGVKFNRFDVQRELERQVYSKENLQPQNQKGR